MRNNANTVRRFFDDAPLATEILGVYKYLIANCKVILKTMLSACAIDVEKFKMHSLDMARRYEDLLLNADINPESFNARIRHKSKLLRCQLIGYPKMLRNLEKKIQPRFSTQIFLGENDTRCVPSASGIVGSTYIELSQISIAEDNRSHLKFKIRFFSELATRERPS